MEKVNQEEEKQEITWEKLEKTLASDVIGQSKRKTNKWFTAWLVTLIALIVTWIFQK